MDEQVLVSSDEWVNLSLDKLFDQRNLLFARYEYLIVSKKDYAARILEGLTKLDDVIAQRIKQ